MKISVFYDHIIEAEKQTGKTLKSILPDIKNYGIDAVEINLTYLCEHEETYELLREAGLEVSCIYEFYDMDKHPEREKAELHIRTALKAGAKRILVVPGFFSKEDVEAMGKVIADYDKTAEFFDGNETALKIAAGLNELADRGAQAGVTVTVEDFDDITSPLSGVNGILWYLNHVKNLQFTFDMGNFLFHGENVLDAWEALKDRIVHVHCKDRRIAVKNHLAEGREDYWPAPAGDGEFPIKCLMERLKAIGYDGYVAIEHFDAPDQERYMRDSSAFLKQYCKG